MGNTSGNHTTFGFCHDSLNSKKVVLGKLNCASDHHVVVNGSTDVCLPSISVNAPTHLQSNYKIKPVSRKTETERISAFQKCGPDEEGFEQRHT